MTAISRCSVLLGLAAGLVASIAAAEDSVPDWFRRPQHPLADLRVQSADEVLLVLQRQRNDGPEMLTLRYPVGQVGPVLAYAGAGMNRAAYYSWTTGDDPGIPLRSRHRSLGAAAEFGAEWRVSPRLAMGANVRWVDLDGEADMLRTGHGLVAADPVALGLSLGWHFR